MTDAEQPAPVPAPASPPAPKRPDPASTVHVTDWIKEPFDESGFRKAMAEHMAALAQEHGLADYTLLYLLDAEDDLSSWHSNRIYNAA